MSFGASTGGHATGPFWTLIELSRRLPAGVRMFTGDDFSYDTLIRGDESGHSDALQDVSSARSPHWPG